MPSRLFSPDLSLHSLPHHDTFATPSQHQFGHLFSPGLSPYFLPQHGGFATPSQHQGFGESDNFSIGNPTPRPILGCRERSSSPYSTPRNRRRLEFGGELGPDKECQISDNGNTEDAPGHAGDLTNDARADGDVDANDDAASDQDIENTGIQRRGRSRGRGRGRAGRGRGGRGNPQRRCPPRGAIAPPAWTHDPRMVRDSDLQEETFEPSQVIQERSDNQLQQPGPIPGPSPHPEPENQVLSSPGYHFVLDLAVACRKFLDNPENSQHPVYQIFDILKNGDNPSGGGASQSRLLSIMTVDTLENIADRCIMAEENMAVTNFVFMVNAIQLRCKVIRLVK